MIFEVRHERFIDVEEAFSRARQLAAERKERILVYHRDDKAWEVTAGVSPDGQVDLTFEGCRFA